MRILSRETGRRTIKISKYGMVHKQESTRNKRTKAIETVGAHPDRWVTCCRLWVDAKSGYTHFEVLTGYKEPYDGTKIKELN